MIELLLIRLKNDLKNCEDCLENEDLEWDEVFETKNKIRYIKDLIYYIES